MHSVDSAMVVFEIDSVALGYQTVATLSRIPAIKVLEASATRASRFMILAEGPAAKIKIANLEVKKLCETFAADLLADVELVENPDPRLVPALYSLSQVEMKESLIVVETDSASGLLAVAQALAHRGLEVIELKAGRGAHGGGLGFFTGPTSVTAAAAEDARTRLKQSVREGRVEVIDGVGPEFRSFFNLNGQG